MTAPPESRPTVLVFHKLATGLTFSVSNYSPSRFERLIDWLISSGWSLSGSPRAVDHKAAGMRGEVVVSFDDGYAHLTERLPELMQRYRLQPLVFVPTDLAGETNRWDYSHGLRSFSHLSVDQIAGLARQGVVFGSHGASHCDLTGCDRRSLARELSDSRKRLQDWTGQPVELVSYPFGRVDQRVRDAAGEAGYTVGYTMDFPKAGDSSLSRGRFPVYAFDTPLSVEAKLASGHLSRLERMKARIVGRLSGGTVWLNRIRG